MKSSLIRTLESAPLKKEKREILTHPVKSIDLEKTESIAQLVESFQDASIQARNVGLAAKVFERMLQDPECPTIILGLAGPLIAAGLRKVIRDMIEYGLVDVIVSTGAILYQDYYQALGFQHYRGTPEADDRKLRDLLIDRIYDTYVDEEKFIFLDSKIGQFANHLKPGEYSSRSFMAALSKSIEDPNSILAAAHRKGIPIFSPALNDSSIGIGLTEHYHRALVEKRKAVVINSIRDNYELTQIVVQSKCTAAVYVAGGVPKNFINDSIVMAYIFGRDTGGHKYAVQMTTDSPHWGGLSGSTLSEATSWGKVNREASTAMAFVEPSVSLPLIAGYALQKKLYKNRSRIHFDWNNDILDDITYSRNRHCDGQRMDRKQSQTLLRRPYGTPRNDRKHTA
ncbi:MAG: deoxyhypusine synthase family protein [Candidatus Omnitrophica bacterium]|nr:deoxyhypusine synthase family protein [Candidatus Omnitrophota bacterium]